MTVESKCGAPSATGLLSRIFGYCGPLAPVLFIILTGLVILTAFRAVLTGLYFSRLSETPHFWQLFVIGIRMDLILLSYVTILPCALLLLLGERQRQRIRIPLMVWFSMFMGVLVYMEIATFPFVDEFDLRPDQKFLEYLKHWREVGMTLVKMYSLELCVGTVFLVFTVRLFWKALSKFWKQASPWGWKGRLLAAPFVLGVLFLGARSSLGHRPANLSTAYFSDNHLANEFALNSTYTVAYAAYRMLRHEKNPSLDYGKMEVEEVFSRVRAKALLPTGDEPGTDIPFLHRQTSPFKYERPPNVVIFLQESMGAVDVGCLKGPPVTPNLCALREQGMWFSDLYATGTRTVRGIEAVVSGFLPTSAVGVLKLGLARTGFFTAAALFAEHGYETEFLYGGMGNFDEMRSFFLGNGFQKIYDQPDFKEPAFLGTWGVSDEDLVRKANETFIGYGDKPFFALMLSTSNHSPYEFPDGRIDLYEEPKQTHLNAIKYADYAIGLLFELAQKEEYFKNTIFLVVADHNSHVRGNEHVPISKFHVPGLLIGPNIPRLEFNRQASQIDLLPTILHFVGFETLHPMVGRNLATSDARDPGRSFMQYGSNNAYRVGDQVVIQRPFLPPEQFTWINEQLTPVSLNPEMARDALAHSHLPWVLYSRKKYNIPR